MNLDDWDAVCPPIKPERFTTADDEEETNMNAKMEDNGDEGSPDDNH